MSFRKLSIVVLLTLHSGCGGASTDVPTTPDSDNAREPEVVTQEPSSYGYARSPLTKLANDVTDIAFAALREEPLPERAIAIERIDPERPLVRVRSDAAFSAEGLEVVGIGLEMELSLGPEEEEGGGDHASEPGEDETTLKTVVYLSPNGLRLAGLEIRSPRLGRPLPSEQSGLGEIAEDILERLRSGSLNEILIGDPERQAIGDDNVWEEITEELPDGELIERAATFARANTGAPRGYRFDDLAILVRDPSGALFALVFDLEHGSDGSLELDSRPLVNVRPVR